MPGTAASRGDEDTCHTAAGIHHQFDGLVPVENLDVDDRAHPVSDVGFQKRSTGQIRLDGPRRLPVEIEPVATEGQRDKRQTRATEHRRAVGCQFLGKTGKEFCQRL